MSQRTIRETDPPAPDTLVEMGDGWSIAAMFYYTAADQRLDHIAEEQGFDFRTVGMLDDRPDDDPLAVRYVDGDDKVIAEWSPATPEGWTFAGKCDGEEGPFAIFVRPKGSA